MRMSLKALIKLVEDLKLRGEDGEVHVSMGLNSLSVDDIRDDNKDVAYSYDSDKDRVFKVLQTKEDL